MAASHSSSDGEQRKAVRKKKRASFSARPPSNSLFFNPEAAVATSDGGLQRLNVRGLQALGAADDFELDRLAVVQRLVAIRLDRGEMDENVLSGLALDEAKAFAGVKPLDCSLFFAHFFYSFR